MTDTFLDNSGRFCVFRTGQDWYGISALAVRSVVPRPLITPMPHSDPSLIGICHLQNEFIPAVSLQAVTNIQYETTADSQQQMIILLSHKGPWGLLIDEAATLAELEVSISTLTDQNDPWSRVLMGSASWQNNVLQVLDPVAICQYTTRLLDMFWQTGQRNEPQLSCS